MIKIIKVTGSSLSPFFLSGDYAIINTAQKIHQKLQSDDIVVFDHPDHGRLIKRVVVNDRNSKTIKVTGYNKESISSHKLGPIPYTNIIGKVIYHIKQNPPKP